MQLHAGQMDGNAMHLSSIALLPLKVSNAIVSSSITRHAIHHASMLTDNTRGKLQVFKL